MASCTWKLPLAAGKATGRHLAKPNETMVSSVRVRLCVVACTDDAACRSFLITRATSEANGVSAAPSPAPGAPPAAPKPSPPPNIYLKDFLPMAKLSWQDDSLTMEDVECVVDSLIDQVSLSPARLAPVEVLLIQCCSYRVSSRATSIMQRSE